jgi:MFS-type transporter involved in bile tolerance (Atg22 family)
VADDKGVLDGDGGAQGGVWAVNFWMPTYLRRVRHLSATGTGLYVAVQAFGALIGFLMGAYLADAIGRKWTSMISVIATIIMVLVYLYSNSGTLGQFVEKKHAVMDRTNLAGSGARAAATSVAPLEPGAGQHAAAVEPGMQR